MKRHLLRVLALSMLLLVGALTSNAQGTYNMCSAPAVVTDSTGTLYDSGGPNGQYVVNENCTLLIHPNCATTISLTVSQFQSETGFDYLYIYDGQNVTDPLLVTLNGTTTTLPVNVTATSGSMLLVWRSDVSIVYDGFAITWTSVIAPSIAPVANLTIDNHNPPLLSNVHFTDNSTNGPTAWLWNFGDGDTARRQNPTHAYNTPGTYIVTFIPFTCSQSDTITDTIIVQDAPQIDVSPLAGFTASLNCGDTATFNLNVANLAGGQLVYNADGSTVGAIRALAMTYGSDQFSEYPNTLQAINQYFSNYTLTQTGTIDPSTLAGLLVGKNVLLIAEQETGDPAVWSSLAPVIQQYVNSGGSVIFCGSFSSESNCMFSVGIFNGTVATNNDLSGSTVTNLLSTHPIMASVPASFTAPSATYPTDLTDANKIRLASVGTSDAVTVRQYGNGKAIFIGFDYFNYGNETSHIIANAMQWAGQNALPSWIHLSQTTGLVNATNTDNITVSFYALGLPAGTYYASIGVNSNDPLSPSISVPCTLTVNAPRPIIGLSTQSVNSGNIIQYVVHNDTVRVYNYGCSNLTISSITTSAPEYTLSASSGSLLPGGYVDLILTFQSSVLGTVTGAITLLNNDIDTVIYVTANVVPAPIIGTVASVSTLVPACAATGTATFDITNNGVAGASNLIYTLGSLPTWVSASQTTGTLAVGATQTITLTFNSGTFAGGTQTTNLAITSNDPQTPVYTLPVDMDVDFNPCVNYTFVSNSCTGISQFTATSINNPTSWAWDFGDQTTSSQQNPLHGFPANGTYTVTLIASNASGSDTVIQTVNAIITGPVAISCLPSTTQYCSACGIGIVRVQLNNINKPSNDAIDGYQNYTCTDTTTLLTLTPYTITITTGNSYQETVKAWLDMDNNGILDPVNELIFFDNTTVAGTPHVGTVTLPIGTVLGQPLRLRVASDYTGNPAPEPCTDLLFGQVEDYSVIVSFFNAVQNVATQTGFNVYPNPFNTSSNIEYSLKSTSTVSVEVFNMVGEKISALALNEKQLTGKHNYRFDCQSSGIYFVKLTVDGSSIVQKIVKM